MARAVATRTGGVEFVTWRSGQIGEIPQVDSFRVGQAFREMVAIVEWPRGDRRLFKGREPWAAMHSAA